MPLIARDKVTDQRIDITKIEDPRKALSANQVACQLCGADMIVIAGSRKINHFRHKVPCSSEYVGHPESNEHLATKAIIADKVAEWMKEFTYTTPELEVPIPEIKRVVDILFTFPNGWRVAHEVQLSPITVAELEQRTNDYLRAGIDVFWWLGKKADTYENREWCTERFGFALYLQYKTSQTDTKLAADIPLGIQDTK